MIEFSWTFKVIYFFFYTHIYYFFTFILFVLIKLNNWYEFKNFDQLYSYNLMIYYPPVILFFDNIINLFFSIELLNLLIFYNLIANFNKNTQSNWKLVNVSTSYFYSLLFLCIINFFANILFFFSLNYLVFYTNSVSLNYWNWFFDNFFNSIVLKKIDLFHQSNFFVIFFLSSFFLKLSLGPVSLLKLELYKNINLWTIIFYSTIYMYIIMLVIFKKFFFFMLILIKTLNVWFLIILNFFFFFFFLNFFNITDLKSFLFYSSYINFLQLMFLFFYQNLVF